MDKEFLVEWELQDFNIKASLFWHRTNSSQWKSVELWHKRNDSARLNWAPNMYILVYCHKGTLKEKCLQQKVFLYLILVDSKYGKCKFSQGLWLIVPVWKGYPEYKWRCFSLYMSKLKQFQWKSGVFCLNVLKIRCQFAIVSPLSLLLFYSVFNLNEVD